MSSVYSAGVHATAITAITAAINTRIVTLSDGTKDLNRESLAAWLRTEFDSMITGGEATSTGFVAGINVDALVQGLNVKIRREAFSGRSDWPSSDVILKPANQAAAVRDALAQLKTASDAVTAHYANTKKRVYDTIMAYLQANKILGSIPDGVDRIVHDRSYVACYVTDRGEISKPSLASAVIQVDQNDTVTVTVPAAPGSRNISYFRLYRGTSGQLTAAYLAVPNASSENGWPIGTLTITDSVPDSKLQEPCPSMTWDEPPADLRGMKAGSNGALAGFTGNTFVPSVNFRPYAFPLGLRRTTPDPIVGLGHFGDTWVVLTRGVPYYATATDTSMLDFKPMGSAVACVSIDSIAETDSGVLFASPNGVCFADASGVRNITDETGFNVFSQADWSALVPSSIKGAVVQGSYLFTYNNGVTTGCYGLNLRTGRLCTLDITASAFYKDEVSGVLYAAHSAAIDALFQSASLRTGRWRGKMAEMDGTAKFSFLRVKDDENKTFDSAVTVKLYEGSTLKETKSVTTVEARRVLPYRYADIAIEVEAATRVTRLTLASSAEGLK